MLQPRAGAETKLIGDQDAELGVYRRAGCLRRWVRFGNWRPYRLGSYTRDLAQSLTTRSVNFTGDMAILSQPGLPGDHDAEPLLSDMGTH